MLNTKLKNRKTESVFSDNSLALRGGSDQKFIMDAPLSGVFESYINRFVSNPNTLRVKKNNRNKFLAFLSDYYTLPEVELRLFHWTPNVSVAFRDELLARGQAPSTVCVTLATLSHVASQVNKLFPWYLSPMLGLKSPEVELPPPRSLTVEQTNELLELARTAASNGGFRELRTLLGIELGLATGLRAAELLSIKLGQCALPDIRRIRCKGGKYRNVYVPACLHSLWNKYLRAREQELYRFDRRLITAGIHGQLPLMVSTASADYWKPDSFKVNDKTFRRSIASLLSDESFHVTPHMLRHTFGHDFFSETKDIVATSQALGHSDVKTTMRYARRQDDELRRALERTARRRA